MVEILGQRLGDRFVALVAVELELADLDVGLAGILIPVLVLVLSAGESRDRPANPGVRRIKLRFLLLSMLPCFL